MHLTWALTGALPALAAMWVVDRMDAKRPEPRWTLRKIALIGALSVIPVIIAELALLALSPPAGTYAQAIWDGVIVAAGVEELAKVLVVYWFVWHLPEFDERLDGIVYATRAGLGFAMVENVLYLAQAATADDFVRTYVLRAILAVPGHAIWAGIMGYYGARKRFDGTGPGLAGGYLLAVALHGAYDLAIFLGQPLRADGLATAADVLLLGPVAIIVVGALILRRMARAALHADDAAEAAAAPRIP
jgi:RsiW-degrading membrane proteinase PrsW (M82 family)